MIDLWGIQSEDNDGPMLINGTTARIDSPIDVPQSDFAWFAEEITSWITLLQRPSFSSDVERERHTYGLELDQPTIQYSYKFPNREDESLSLVVFLDRGWNATIPSPSSSSSSSSDGDLP